MKMFQLCFLFILFYVHLGETFPKLDGRIVGGTKTNIENFPHQVSLLYLDEHKCGGSIIGRRHVLTAAHCTNEYSFKYLQVRYGSSILNDGGTVVNITEVHQHPSFDAKSYDYDISVLELAEDITLQESSKVIPMVAFNKVIPAGTKVIVSGWGHTKEGGSYSDQLQYVELPVVEANVCEAAYHPDPITDRMICAGYVGVGEKDACQGDSGGPLIANGKLVGVVSWGEGCARPDYPGIFANVAKLRNFVKDVAGI